VPGTPAELSSRGDARFCGDDDRERGIDQARVKLLSGLKIRTPMFWRICVSGWAEMWKK